MKHIALHYFFRNESNDKTHAKRIFSCDDSLSLAAANEELESLLIDNVFLVPNRIGLPTIDPVSAADPDDDDDYHEFESIHFTDEPVNDDRTFEEFLDVLHTYQEENPDEYEW